MGKIAFVFSGQGAQYPGMGKELCEASKSVAELYDNCEKIRVGTKNQSFAGTAEELKLTENTQPCMYLADLAAAVALKEQGVTPDVVAGFSLGEVAALSFAGAYSYEDGFKIVCKRGQLMAKASEGIDSKMVAVLKLDNETVEKTASEFEKVYPVNYNCPGQIVVSGLSEQIEKFKEEITKLPCRCMDLAVSAAFHSPFMISASEGLAEELKGYEIKKPEIPVYANYTAQPYEDNVSKILPKQVSGPVLWHKTVESMITDGVDTFIEVGVGKTLCGLIKKISKDVAVYNVENAQTLADTVKAVNGNA